MRKKLFTIMLFIIAGLFTAMPAAGEGNIVLSRDYQPTGVSELPQVLNVGIPLECGRYEIRIMGQPIITKSSLGMVADLDLYYLIIRVGLTNIGEQTIGWLTPDSFEIRETYHGRVYGTYKMDPIISAKIATGFKLPAFYTQIEPGGSIQTTLVFSVYYGAESWILTFAPHVFGDEAAKTIEFQIPQGLMQ